MTSHVPVLVPQENVNDEFMTLARWLVAEGDQVREGQSIAEIETSKAIIELNAPSAGRVAILTPQGAEIKAGDVIAHLLAESAVESAPALVALPVRTEKIDEPAAKTDTETSENAGVRFSRRALELMEQAGLSPELFRDRALVREADVRERIEAMAKERQAGAARPPRLESISLEGVTLPEWSFSTDSGLLDPEFVTGLRRNHEEFAHLSSAEKCRRYREAGAFIGRDVEIGAGTVILASSLILEDEVRVGAYGSIDCTGPFVMGALSSIRDGADVEAAAVVLGKNVYACRRIEISGGRNPYSALYVGDATFIGDDVILDVTRPIVLGREVFLTQRAIVITHNIGHSILDGFENRFEAVVLEDRCQIGMNCTVYAGARVGQEAIVASNSYVVSSIAPGKLAMGVPAREVRDAARRLDRSKQIRIARQMVDDLRQWLALRGREVRQTGVASFLLRHAGGSFQLVFTERFPASDIRLESADETMIWALETHAPAPDGCTLVNLLEKTIDGAGSIAADSAREFLRKRGIRLEPQPWRYRQGLL